MSLNKLNDLSVNPSPALDKLLIAAAGGAEGQRWTTTNDGEKLLGMMRYIRLTSETGWGLVLTRSESSMRHPIDDALDGLYLAFLLIGLLAMLFAVWGARSISTPIAALVRTARQIQAGDLRQRAPLTRDLETGLLTQTFNEMVERLQQSQATLEQAVEQRTQDLERLTRLYAALTNTSQAIISIDNDVTLFQRVCEIAIEDGGFKMAWIGERSADHPDLIIPVSCAGSGTDYLTEFEVRLDAKTGHADPVQLCMSQGEIINLDIHSSSFEPSRSAAALARGFGSVAAVPLYRNKEVSGVLVVYALEAEYFTPAMIDLLAEMGADVSFSLDRIESGALARQREKRILQLSQVVEQNQGSIMITDTEGDIVYVNAAFVELTGFSALEMTGKNPRLFQSGKTDPALYRELWEAISAGSRWQGEMLNRKRNGDFFWAKLSVFGIRDEAGALCNFVAITEDITQHREIERSLEENAKRFKAVFSTAADAILVSDSEGRIVLWNPAAESLFGIASDDIVGSMLHQRILPKRFHQQVDVGIQAFRPSGGDPVFGKTIEVEIIHSDGHAFPAELTTTEFDLQGEYFAVGFVRDISERKDAEAALRHQAMYDFLTGLPNRALFQDRVKHAIAQCQRDDKHHFALVFLDLNRFKTINDSLGHSFGDLLLKEVGIRLNACVRPEDSVARVGGDEFAVLLERPDGQHDVIRVVKRIVEALKQPLDLQGHRIYSGASCGITFYDGHYTSPEEMLRDADTAMYQAKMDTEHDYKLFDSNMHTHAVSWLEAENDIRRGLLHDEFVPWFQPIVSRRLGRVVGVEALARWNHPHKGVVGPYDFIPLAEETGLITGLSWSMIEQIFQACNSWPGNPELEHMYISINISALQFKQANFALEFCKLTDKAGIAPKRIRLEVTESVFMADIDLLESQIRILQDAGFGLYLDDFGTGYSSLSYLHRFPFTAVKVDRSFVIAIDLKNKYYGLIPVIQQIASYLKMELIAEGVEDLKTEQALELLGFDLIQGFLHSPPVPLERLAETVSRINKGQLVV